MHIARQVEVLPELLDLQLSMAYRVVTTRVDRKTSWRGFALPRLLDRHSALTASLILGSLWALFHLPLFFTRGDSFASTPPLSFLVRMIGAAILFTWLFNNTGGSLLLAYLMHAASNFWPRVLPIGAMSSPFA